MKKPTKRQLELLKVLNPYLGNTTYADAAEKLDTTEKSIKDMMSRLKVRCPEVYESFNELRKNLNRGQNKVDNAVVIRPNKLNNLNILEKF